MSNEERRRMARTMAAAYLICNKSTFDYSDETAFLKKFQSAFDDFITMLESEQGVN